MIQPHTVATAIAALRQMETLHPFDARWPNAIHDLRAEALLDVAREVSADSRRAGVRA